jgi:glycosyltransferase involved in cell wall biosynthesis
MQTAAAKLSDTAQGSADSRWLAGRLVILVHPAWHSCGSHQVFVSQAQAYRDMGATVFSLAVADFPGWIEGSKAHLDYLAATPDLAADRRFYAGMPRRQILRPRFLNAARQWLQGNAAAMLCATVESAELPRELISLPKIDLIHCNHFFCMPAALTVKGDRACPILLDTHDVQARQFSLRNEGRFVLPPKATFADMLAVELSQMRKADLLIHLNDEEAAEWRNLLPQRRHALVYPAIKPMPTGPGGRDIVIVASANHPNYLSIAWFLREVRPLTPDIPLRIIGNVDEMVRARAPALFAANAQLFHGRIDDLDEAYAKAATILLPTVSGHGISIKTIEALSSGAPLIATREAFRGIAIDPTSLANVTLLDDAKSFAAALRDAAAKQPVSASERKTSDTRRLYDRLFSFEAYRCAISAVARPLLAAG